jgi:hypothetical protein
MIPQGYATWAFTLTERDAHRQAQDVAIKGDQAMKKDRGGERE